MTWLLLAAAILLEVAATLSLRASEGLKRKRWIAPVAIFYIAAFALFTGALAQGMPAGIAYGIWAACGVALTASGARAFLKEPLTRRMAWGIGLVAVGVLVIELGVSIHCSSTTFDTRQFLCFHGITAVLVRRLETDEDDDDPDAPRAASDN